MKRTILIALASLSLIACDKPAEEAPSKAPEAPKAAAEDEQPDKPKKAEAADAHAAFTNLSAEAVEKLVADKGCVPIDVNSAETRSKYGVVPGAVLLTKAQGYDMSELPADKDAKLVFYCGGEKCSAAPKAATVAVDSGYSDVNVMRVGIRGWVDAGKTIDKPKS